MTKFPERCGDIHVEVRSILRIRQLKRKERDEPIALEPLQCGRAVLLKPINLNCSSSQQRNPLDTVHDREFRFEKVFSSSETAEKVYAGVGLPIALQAMEPFKSLPEVHAAASTKSHLIVCTGLEKSGTTFTSSDSLQKQKLDSDGLLPRILDSLYIQAKHQNQHLFKNNIFGVNMTILQINELKTHPNDCHIFDLLQPSNSKHVKSGDRIIRMVNQLIIGRQNVPFSTKSNTGFGEQQVSIHRTPKAKDCKLTNVLPYFCTSTVKSRELLLLAMKRRQKHSGSKYQSHLFINLQPILFSSRYGQIVRWGDTITILDMTRFAYKEHVTCLRDPLQAGAYTAVINCLKAIVATNKASMDNYSTVPYMQHQFTMLLQPLFTSQSSPTGISITLMTTVSPSNQHYVDKKNLLTDIQQIRCSTPKNSICNVDNFNDNATKRAKQRNDYTVPHDDRKQSKLKTSQLQSAYSNMNSIYALKVNQIGAGKKYSVRTNDDLIPLPPPVAPGFKDCCDRTRESACSHATAPVEDSKILKSPIECRCNQSDTVETDDNTFGLASNVSITYVTTLGLAVPLANEKNGNDVNRTENSNRHQFVAATSGLQNTQCACVSERNDWTLTNAEARCRGKGNKKIENNGELYNTFRSHHTLDNASEYSNEFQPEVKFTSGSRDSIEDGHCTVYTTDPMRRPTLGFDDPLFDHMALMNNLH
jgi:hypothetical protein